MVLCFSCSLATLSLYYICFGGQGLSLPICFYSNRVLFEFPGMNVMQIIHKQSNRFKHIFCTRSNSHLFLMEPEGKTLKQTRNKTNPWTPNPAKPYLVNNSGIIFPAYFCKLMRFRHLKLASKLGTALFLLSIDWNSFGVWSL